MNRHFHQRYDIRTAYSTSFIRFILSAASMLFALSVWNYLRVQYEMNQRKKKKKVKNKTKQKNRRRNA